MRSLMATSGSLVANNDPGSLMISAAESIGPGSLVNEVELYKVGWGA